MGTELVGFWMKSTIGKIVPVPFLACVMTALKMLKKCFVGVFLRVRGVIAARVRLVFVPLLP